MQMSELVTMEILLNLVIFALISAILILMYRRPKNFPPGPRGLPILGYIPFLGKHDPDFPHKAMKKLADLYGPVTGFYLGPTQANISVCGYAAVKEALLNKDLDGRPTSAARRERTFGERLGIMFIDGDFFREQRRFTLRHLRDLGFGRTSSESFIQEEIRVLVDEMCESAAKHPKRVVNFKGLFTLPLINILWAVVGGVRLERHDLRLRKILDIMEVFFRSGRDVRANIPVPGLVLRNVPFVRKFLSLRNDTFGPLQDFIRETIDEHEKNIDDNNPRDFIDVYLAEMRKQKSSNPNTSFQKNQLISLIIDLFIAAGETTGNAIGFAMLYLLHNPEVLRKVHAELDECCGTSLPSLSHRPKLPYLEAVLLETLRLSNITPLTIPHYATKDTQLAGFCIPKGSILSMNLYAVHFDENHWDEPNVFRPDRHLNMDGKLLKTDHLLPFGVGKRACPGESLARNTFFLFTATLLKIFELKPNEELPTLEPKLGFTSGYQGFEAIVIPRDYEA